MKKVLPILSAISAGVIFFCIGKGVGEWWADTLKDSGGMVTARDIIGCRWGIPIGAALLAAYVAYYLTKDRD